MLHRLTGFGLALLAACPAAYAAGAEDYPNRPVRMIVGFPPGGGTDIMARIIAPKLTEAWNHQVVIDNRIGATGTIGATLVARGASTLAHDCASERDRRQRITPCP